MEDQLISFKTAKLAKEKGFGLPSAYYYVKEYGNIKEVKFSKRYP